MQAPHYVCDVCLFTADDEAIINEHVRTEHGLEPGPVGSIEQHDGILTVTDGSGTMMIDLEVWLAAMLSGSDPGVSVLRNTRTGEAANA